MVWHRHSLSVLLMLGLPEKINHVTFVTTRRDHVYGRIRGRALT